MKYIIVAGSPTDGFTFTGPFDTADEALDYAEQVDDGRAWWIGDLHEALE